MNSKSQKFMLTLLLLLFMLSVAQLVGGIKKPRGGELIPCAIECSEPVHTACGRHCMGEQSKMTCAIYWGYTSEEECYEDLLPDPPP